MVTNVIREEEASFLRTLDKGLDLLEEEIRAITVTVYSPEGNIISHEEKIRILYQEIQRLNFMILTDFLLI